MRTTVDLPAAAHVRVKSLAASRGQSMSSVIADLTLRALSQIDDPIRVGTDARTGLPVLSIGRPLTSEQVAAHLDDE